MNRETYEKEYLEWKIQQNLLRKKYPNTPPGFTRKEMEEQAEKELQRAWEAYRKKVYLEEGEGRVKRKGEC